jgi:predicted HTH transcriptional regulator
MIEGGQIRGQKLTERKKQLLDLIKVNPSISRSEISKKLNIQPSTIQMYIAELGINEDEHIQLCINAMKGISNDLGL